VYFPRQVRRELTHVGGRPDTGYGAWVVSPTNLSSESVVYSFGIGDEISFDLDLIRRFDVRVHAFDPTPASHRWLEAQQLPDAFIPYTYGLAHYDGTATFYAPTNPSWISHSLLAAEHTQDVELEVPVRRLATVMTELGHDHIDLLKMDIEGAEYEVVEDLVESNLDVRQVLVEFHHRFDSIPPACTAEAVRRLNSIGFRIAHVSPRGEEYTFVRA
jgi:FkbM family methyltransferase